MSEEVTELNLRMSTSSKSSSVDSMAEAKKKFERLRKLRDWGEITEDDYNSRKTQIVDQLTETVDYFEPRLSRMSSRASLPGLAYHGRYSMDIASTSGQSTIEQIKRYPPPDWDKVPLERGIKISWNTLTKNWEKDQINVKLDNRRPFAEGTLRAVYHIWDQTDPDIMYCAKLSKDRRDQQTKQIYFQDVKAQAIASQLGRIFNSRFPPKTVEFIHAYVLVLLDRGNAVCGVERFIAGTYFKYNDNTFWENELHRNTPAAFSHFTYEFSNHEILVCDIQGVGDCYTDPQVHSVLGGSAFGKGDRGDAGIRDFLSSHHCNKVCEYLNLPNVLGVPTKSGGTVPLTNTLYPVPQNWNYEGHKDGMKTPLLRDGSIDELDWIPKVRSGSIFYQHSEQEEDRVCCYCCKII